MDRKKYITCPYQRQDCDANRDGVCIALKSADFGGKPCPFYKSYQQAERDWLDTIAQLVSQGKYDEAYRCAERDWLLWL